MERNDAKLTMQVLKTCEDLGKEVPWFGSIWAPLLACIYFMPANFTLLTSHTLHKHFSLCRRIKCFMSRTSLWLPHMSYWSFQELPLNLVLVGQRNFFFSDHKNSGLTVLMLFIPELQSISLGDLWISEQCFYSRMLYLRASLMQRLPTVVTAMAVCISIQFLLLLLKWEECKM